MSAVEQEYQEKRITYCLYEIWEEIAENNELPSLKKIQQSDILPFKDNLVLIDRRNEDTQPTFQVIGNHLKDDLDIDLLYKPVTDVPRRTMLSRVADHYLEVIANRVPIAFEAEFVNRDGEKALYRGILLPFSDDNKNINFILGGVRWLLEKDVILDDDTPSMEELMRSISQGVAQSRAEEEVDYENEDEIETAAEVVEDTHEEDNLEEEVSLEPVGLSENISDDTTELSDDTPAEPQEETLEIEIEQTSSYEDNIINELLNPIKEDTPELETQEESLSEVTTSTEPDEIFVDENVDGEIEVIKETEELVLEADETIEEALIDAPIIEKVEEPLMDEPKEDIEINEFEDVISEPETEEAFENISAEISEPVIENIPTSEVVEPLTLEQLETNLRQIIDYINKEDANHNRSRDSLYNILEAIYGFHKISTQSPNAFKSIIKKHDLKAQKRAPFTPVLKICLGKDYDKTRLTEYAAALGLAQHMNIEVSEFQSFIKNFPSGIKGCVKEMRSIRKTGSMSEPVIAKGPSLEDAKETLSEMPTIGSFKLQNVILGDNTNEFCLLLAKRSGHYIDILKILDEKSTNIEPILKRTAFIRGKQKIP
ncbi:MAG: PAS domain-containing protein [Kordiimonadaceae bacterium]|jgi:hypothetical protein|nr:PAS domain-containing protein [Kordiimonadaceae bacterium]MBT6032723.1 PAS domain-containing protein [Kordiimonadaceae bacterium]